jgi:hypothetical protein
MECHKLVCTNDKAYTDVRNALALAGGKSQTAIVSIIASAVAVKLGMIAASLVPLCALCLLAIAR